jgi:hypothetical protein
MAFISNAVFQFYADAVKADLYLLPAALEVILGE